MKQWLHKKPMRPMQKPMPREMELPSGISNQAMLSMLESQGMQDVYKRQSRYSGILYCRHTLWISPSSARV